MARVPQLYLKGKTGELLKLQEKERRVSATLHSPSARDCTPKENSLNAAEEGLGKGPNTIS